MVARPLARIDRKRAVLYLRQSTYREESISLELQERAGRDYCRQHGYDVVAVEADPGISGRTWKRPAVQRVMGMIEDGSADVVVLWKWSRLSRNRKDWALAIDKADVAGGMIESATEPIDTATASGRFARGLMTEYAAFQSEQIGEQWREAHARRRRLGLPSDGAERYGYLKQEDGHYAPHPEEAPILAQMYRRYLAGDGFTKIVVWLNESGHRTRLGREWSRVTVTHLLDAGFGAGQIIHRAQGPGGKRDWRMSAAVYYPGAQESLISPAEWDAYVARRMDAPEPSRVVAGKYLLTGLIFCGDCGAAMHVGNAGLIDYKCSRATQYRDVPGMYMTRRLIEQRVREWVSEVASDIETLTGLLAKQRARQVVQLDNLQTLDRKIDALKDQLGRITVRWSSGKMPDAAYEASVEQLESERAALVARRKAAAPRARVEVDPAQLVMDLDRDWDDMLLDERRRMLRALVRSVRIVKPSRPGTGVWRERVQITPTWTPVG